MAATPRQTISRRGLVAALAVLALARQKEPELLVTQTLTMYRHLAVSLLPHRLSAVIISTFGVLALLLASIGLYGVVSYAVSTRSRERWTSPGTTTVRWRRSGRSRTRTDQATIST